MPGHHLAVDRADLVGEDNDDIPHGHIAKRHVDDPPCLAAMSERRHPPGERRQHTPRSAHRARLERLPAGKHEHNQRPGQPLPEEGTREDRHPGEEIGPKHPGQHLPQEPGHKDRPADQKDQQEGQIGAGRRRGPPSRQHLPQRREGRHLTSAHPDKQPMDHQRHKHADGDRLMDRKGPGRPSAGMKLRAGRGGSLRGAGQVLRPVWRVDRMEAGPAPGGRSPRGLLTSYFLRSASAAPIPPRP